MSDVPDRLANCFQAVFPDLHGSHIATASTRSIPGWDSVAAINLLTVIEEEFGIEIPLEEFGQLISYELILAAVTRAMEGRRTSSAGGSG